MPRTPRGGLARRLLPVVRGHQRVHGPRGRVARLVLRRRQRRHADRGAGDVRGQPHRGGVLPVPERVGASGSSAEGREAAVVGPRRRGGGRRLLLLPARPVIPSNDAVADLR